MMRRSLLRLVAIAAMATPCLAHAQAPASRPSSVEARERFERGLHLFDAGEDAGALAEFKRAYDLSASVVALYNMGLVYAQMGRAVEATEVLDRVLAAAPGSLSPERLTLARRRRDEQAARVAQVALSASVDGAAIEVDGVEVAKSPLAGPLHVTSGAHVIGAVASGFEPSRKAITIAGGETQSLRLELVAMQGRLAHIAVKTHLPGADVFVDDQRVAATPLATSIAVAPGKHRIELRRAAYATAHAELTLDDGATGEVTLEPQEDRGEVASSGGELALQVTETAAVVTIDGRERGVYAGPLRLAAGPHHLLVERGDFEPFERDASVEPQGLVTIRVSLEPTPDFRLRYVSRANAIRTWGIVSLVGGAVLAGGGVGLLIYDANQRSAGYATRNALLAQNAKGQACDAKAANTTYTLDCANPVNAATAQVNNANARDDAGWIAVGVGAAAAALGVTLIATGGNPGKYDVRPPDPAAGLRWLPTGWTARGGGGLGLIGSF
jgi:hypothetical protein